MYANIEKEAAAAAEELLLAAKLKKGNIVVIGCSTSEVCGSKIGTASVPEAADALYRGLKSVFAPHGSQRVGQDLAAKQQQHSG